MPSFISSPLSSPTTLMMTQVTSPRADAKLDAAAHDFEAMFISEMLKPMVESVEIDDMFGGGKGEEVFRSMMTEEYGKLLAKSGGIGLASPVKQALLAAQAKAHNEQKPEVNEAQK